MDDRILRLSADFNGIFGNVLCLSHRETCRDEDGNEIEVQEGQRAIAFEPNYEGDERDDLIAEGTVARSPEPLRHKGSRWVLLIDEHGVGFESERPDLKEQ